MELPKMTIDWGVLIPLMAPMLVGILQQISKSFEEKPYYIKIPVTTIIGALMTMLTNLVAQGETSVLLGATVATIGSVNIALRKGVGRYMAPTNQPPVP